MKSYNNIYNKICEYNNIESMIHKVLLKTSNKRRVDKFETYLVEHTYNIKKVLVSRNYKPGKFNLFFIREPKLRLIMSQNIFDKVINHLVAKYFLVDLFDKSFIETNIATRVGRGTHYGIKLIKKYINELKKENDTFYYLKFDIKKYFYNIDHEIIKDILKKRIKDKDALNIIFKIIDSTNEPYINENIKKLKDIEKEKIYKKSISDIEKNKMIQEIDAIPYYKDKKGFPIGNMTSQVFAILYLNELDHYIKEKLHIKYYVRYMDDGVLFSCNKEYLNYCLEKIKKILSKYKLELNANKTKINCIKCPLNFLGFRFILKDNKLILKVRNSTKKKFNKKVKVLNELYKYDYITYKEYKDNLASYKGHLSWGNCGCLFNYNLFK